MPKQIPMSKLLRWKPLIAWLRKQPAKKRYEYLDTHNCLLCQYLKAHGYEGVHAGGVSITGSGRTVRIPEKMSTFVTPEAGSTTFGAALERAKKIAHA